MKPRTREDVEMIAAAFFHLNRRHRVLAPASEARVTYPPYDPCRAVQAVALVEWPAVVNCREVTLTHSISDNEPAPLPATVARIDRELQAR